MIRRFLLPGLAALVLAPPAPAAVWRITNGMDAQQTQDVMDTAAYGDTVLVEPGQYPMLTVRTGIHLLGEKGPEETVFRNSRVVLTADETDSTTVIEGITVDGVKASEGVIAMEHSQARIRNCIIRNGWVGVRAAFSDIIVENCRISHCQNGIYVYETSGVISGNDIRQCVNGIQFVNSSPRVYRNEITQNSLGLLIEEHSNPEIGGSFATANRIHGNPGGAVKNNALEKRGGLRTMNPYTVKAPYNYWGTDCPEKSLFRGDFDWSPWVDGTGKKSIANCEETAAE